MISINLIIKVNIVFMKIMRLSLITKFQILKNYHYQIESFFKQKFHVIVIGNNPILFIECLHYWCCGNHN